MKDKIFVFRNLSKHDIPNALTHKHLPLPADIHGVYEMTPPELLHTSGSGLIMYMFKSLKSIFGSGKSGMDHRHVLNKLHQQILVEIQRQSERDFLRGSVKNGIIDETKCQSDERRGNLFLLLCLAYTSAGRKAL